MRQKHLIKRGNRFQFVCRIPNDLKIYFPLKVFYHTLKATDNKSARLLASAKEYQIQQLFMQLRSGMLSKHLENKLVASFLLNGTCRIEATVTGSPFQNDHPSATPVDFVFKDAAKKQHKGREKFPDGFKSLPDAKIKEALIKLLTEDREFLCQMLKNKEPGYSCFDMELLAKKLLEHAGVRLSELEQDRLALKLIEAQMQLHDAEVQALDGDWSGLRSIQDTARGVLREPYWDFKTVLEKYQEHYLVSKPSLKAGTKADMAVECRVLLEIIGNVSITAVNTMDSVSKLKRILKKYPKNKLQKFGTKSIHTIMNAEKGYEKISLKTANEYIKRLKAVIDYTNKAKMLDSANVVPGELFSVEVAEEEQRLAYDSGDISRLLIAICTQPLWKYNPPKPERFWIILIALFHGLRLGNIIALTKEDICQTDRGTWIFNLKQAKTTNSVRPVAICDTLLQLGFLEWTKGLDRNKLFQDSVSSFSKWYNRDERRSDGYTVLGFESRFVTKDKKKCLYSLRHSFATSVFEVTEDYKITADLMGHSTGKSVTARYTKRTRAEILKEVTEKLRLEWLDFDRLEARANELFSLRRKSPLLQEKDSRGDSAWRASGLIVTEPDQDHQAEAAILTFS